MPITNRLKNQHLLWRAAFGPMVEITSSLDKKSSSEIWKLLKETSKPVPDKIVVADDMTDGMMNGLKSTVAMNQTTDDKAMMQRIKRKQRRTEISNLNLIWLSEMVNSKAQLREKIAFFWHGHFACKVLNSFFSQDLLHVLRTNALGNFGTMLKEVSKSPAMLQYLNNQQNRKGHPNENFAREVMELFTMGIGNYTENDIKEGARAFTGWGYDIKGKFVFKAAQHDDGEKIFLGKKGRFNGDDIIDILLQQPKTAEYISRKIYKYFVNEVGNETKIKSLAADFYASNYDISKLLDGIFGSDWFYEEKNIGTRIKSPIELMVGIRRFLPMEFDNENGQLLFQKVLGQVLFYPPNVAGWPGGTTWIDSSTLMLRMQMPQVFAAKENITIKPKNDDDVNMGKVDDKSEIINNKPKVTNRNANANIDWSLPLAVFEKTSRAELLQVIASQLWQTSNRLPETTLQTYLDQTTRESFIKSVIIHLMSTPEYQMC